MSNAMPSLRPSLVTPPGRLWPLQGEFVDAALEQSFRESTLQQVVSQQRTSLLVWAILLLLFAVPDYLAMGPVPWFWVLMGYRAGMAVLLLGYMHALQRAPALALHNHILMWLGLLAYPFFFLFYAVRPDVRAINTGVIMVVQLTMFLFIPSRVKLTIPVALFGAVGTTVSYWWTSPADAATKAATVLLVTMPAVMGYVAALRQQKTERQEFWLRQQLQDANRELQGEVARRVALQVELERQAATDLLTGLPNRRALAERFPIEAARAQRTGEALSLVMFDLDHFKQVNDRYGHAGGDAVLRGVGQLCIGSFRGVDMAARVGGEEFAVLLPGASAQQAGAVMERFLHTLGGLDMDIGPHNVRVTATAGVAQQQPGEDLDALMARADTALYAGKQAGRNRVVLAPAPG
jgi:diguanylate cyclase (GGDEF)-like protein